MAEKGAHITANLQDKPSIFEIIAQDSLANTLPPALYKVTEFLAAKNPELYGWLFTWFDEIYLGLNTLIQYHYIKYHDASFAETFYGLCRVSYNSQKLSVKDKFTSLVSLTLLPYLSKKFEQYSYRYRLEYVDGLLRENNLKNKSKRILPRIHTTFRIVVGLSQLTHYLQYMSGQTQHHSLLLRLLTITLKHSRSENVTFSWSLLWKCILSKNWSSSTSSVKLLGLGLIQFMELGAFFIQFLQWWHAEKTQVDLTVLPVPKHPVSDPQSNQYKGICPICLQPWVIPTVLPVSGYVFCYRCLINHLKTNQYCPITKYPASIEELIRVYDQ